MENIQTLVSFSPYVKTTVQIFCCTDLTVGLEEDNLNDSMFVVLISSGSWKIPGSLFSFII